MVGAKGGLFSPLFLDSHRVSGADQREVCPALFA